MAGILEAHRLISEELDRGKCLATGTFNDGRTSNKYAIFKSIDDSIYLTAFDYGSDITIDDDIVPGDEIRLLITSDTTAKWCRGK